MKLPSPVIAALEVAINNALRLDNDTLQRVIHLQGKVIKIRFKVVDAEFYLAPVADGIQVLAEYDNEADTTISGSPFALLRTALSDNRQTLLQGDVTIEGDTDLGQKFQKILKQLDPDWEEPLAKIFGDVAGHQLGEMIRGFAMLAKNTFNSLSVSTAEYVQEESRDVVTSTELSRFADKVDQTRSDTDRLQARIERLQKKLRESLS